MKWERLAMVTIIFHGRDLSETNIQSLEQFLRKNENIDYLTIHPKEITFYIWGQSRIDYKILDDLKTELKNEGCAEFEISVEEYRWEGNNYHYIDKGGQVG